MALLAPYSDAMKLGSGFNSFTQELCLDGAVIREDGKAIDSGFVEAEAGQKTPKMVAQAVTYKTSIIDKISDIFDNMNINAAFTIKFAKGSVGAGADFLNVSKVKSSDLTYMVSVKVVNQLTVDSSLTKFSTVPGVKPADFPRVYGDSFISGFQEGGEFTAVISVRAKDRSQANNIKADAAVSLTLSEPTSGSLDLAIDKSKRELLTENETTVMVMWTGGGQGIKKPEEDWTFETMRAAALKFPDLVAKCPVRTHAVLTKYSSLKSFYAVSTQFNVLSYEAARVYTSALRDAFLDYQNIAKNLQVLALDVSAGTQRLISQKENIDKDFAHKTLKTSDPSLLGNIMGETQIGSLQKELETKNTPAVTAGEHGAADSAQTKVPASESGSEEAIVIDAKDRKQIPEHGDAPKEEDSAIEKAAPPKAINPLVIDQPYPPTIYGLEAARMQCRFMMNRIVAEVDNVANHPEIATDESRPLPYMSPFLFNMLLPVGLQVNVNHA